MVSDSDKLRQLCQNLRNTTDPQKAVALADEIDSLVATFSTVAFGYMRGELAVTFQHTSYGPIIDRAKHPLLLSKQKSDKSAKEETLA